MAKLEDSCRTVWNADMDGWVDHPSTVCPGTDLHELRPKDCVALEVTMGNSRRINLVFTPSLIPTARKYGLYMRVHNYLSVWVSVKCSLRVNLMEFVSFCGSHVFLVDGFSSSRRLH